MQQVVAEYPWYSCVLVLKIFVAAYSTRVSGSSKVAITPCDDVVEPFSAILAYFQIMGHEYCVFCLEPLQPTQGSWFAPLEAPKSPKRGPF